MPSISKKKKKLEIDYKQSRYFYKVINSIFICFLLIQAGAIAIKLLKDAVVINYH